MYQEKKIERKQRCDNQVLKFVVSKFNTPLKLGPAGRAKSN